jgi:hypothetical protein
MIKSISILLTLILPIFGEISNIQLPNNLIDFVATTINNYDLLVIAGGLINSVFNPHIYGYSIYGYSIYWGQRKYLGSLKNISKFSTLLNINKAINVKDSLIIFGGLSNSLNNVLEIINTYTGSNDVLFLNEYENCIYDMTYIDESNQLIKVSNKMAPFMVVFSIFSGYNDIYMLNMSTYQTTNITIQTNISASFLNSFSKKNLVIFAGEKPKLSEGQPNTFGLVIFNISTSLFEVIILDNNDDSMIGILGLSVYENYELCVVFSSTKIYIYDLKTKSLSFSLIPTPVGGYSTPKKIYSGLIFIAGGILQTNIPYVNVPVTGLVQIYNIFTKTWSINYLQNPAFGTIAINIKNYSNNETLLILGGSQGLNGPYLNDVNQFSLCPERTYLPSIFSFGPNNKCHICFAGYFCPAGTLLNNIGRISTQCNAGYYCPQGSYQQTACPAGTYNSYSGQISENNCLSCPAGTFNIFTGQTSIINCLQCSQGTICNEKSAIPFNCPANYYCPNPTQQIACPIGTFFNGESATNLSSCTPCQKGSFCSGNGLNAIPCEAGSYSDKQGNSNCNDCPPGQFTNGPGAASCFPCPSDKFKGWWCASDSEKIIFVFITLGSIGSGLATAWKLYKFYNVRKLLLTNEGIPITWRNVAFVEQAIEQKKKTEMTEIGGGDETPILQADQLKKVQDTIFTMQTKITLLEAK